MISILLGFIYANFLDWGTHILLHKPRGKSRFKFHWKHHYEARTNENVDSDYKQKLFHNETWITLAAIVLHTPLFWYVPVFALVTVAYAAVYMVLHRKSHEHIEFFRRWMPWHYEHHMGKNQNKNWCVVCPLMDHVMGTRDKWLNKN